MADHVNKNKITKGITHFEDLPITKIVSIIKNLQDYIVTEKVDGSQLLFGIDEIGFYTSRESRGGKRHYQESDYLVSFSTSYMRAAHKLLSQVLPTLKDAGLSLNDQVEVEVLYGAVPNVVPYMSDINRIIFLRNVSGMTALRSLNEALSEKIFDISLDVPYTDDGINIRMKSQIQSWCFSTVPSYEFDIDKINRLLKFDYDYLIGFIHEDSGICGQTNLTIYQTKLNSCPQWCPKEKWKTIKDRVATKREYIESTLYTCHVDNLKSILLSYFVEDQISAYGPPLEDGGWIEGVVFVNKFHGTKFKLVDKTMFGVKHKEAWHDRNSIMSLPVSLTGQQSLLGETLIKMGESIGNPMLGTIHGVKYCKDVKSTITLTDIKELWCELINHTLDNLQFKLDKYEEENKIEAHQVFGAEMVARLFVSLRTKEVFAETKKRLVGMLSSIGSAKDINELVDILVRRQ